MRAHCRAQPFLARFLAFSFVGGLVLAGPGSVPAAAQNEFFISGGTWIDREPGLLGTAFIFNPVAPAPIVEVFVEGPGGWNDDETFSCGPFQPEGMVSTRAMCWSDIQARDGVYHAVAMTESGEELEASFSIDTSSRLSPPDITGLDASTDHVSFTWDDPAADAKSYLVRVNPEPHTGETFDLVVPGTARTATLTNLALEPGAVYQAVVWGFSHDLVTAGSISPQFDIASDDEFVTIPSVSPTGWAIVQSLRPTFTWPGIVSATSYVLTIHRARGTLENPVRGEEVKRLEIFPSQLTCVGSSPSLPEGVCSFKPGFPSPNSSDPTRFELTSHLSQVKGGFDPLHDDPDDSLLGYVWQVEAVENGSVIARLEGEFQIPPLGSWEVASYSPASATYPCLVHPYCRDTEFWSDGYPGGYWNYFDDSFYRWGEVFDVPPYILKAIAYGETASALGPRDIDQDPEVTDYRSPTRAFAYEANQDFKNLNQNCKGECRDFLVTCSDDKSDCFVPDKRPYDTPVDLRSISIRNFYREVGFTNGFDGIPGCSDFSSSECKENTDRDAEYRVMSSYGVGQVVFSAAWSTLSRIAQNRLLSPETLYEADYSIRAMAAHVGVDKRCASMRFGRPYAGIESPFTDWEDSVSRFNGLGGRSSYSDAVAQRTSVTDPRRFREGFDVLYELGFRADIQKVVTDLADVTCYTTNELYGEALKGYLDKLGVPAPQDLSGFTVTRAPGAASGLASIRQALSFTPAPERELSTIAVDLRGDGSQVFVALVLGSFGTVGRSGVIRIYEDASRQDVLWESEPLAENILDAGALHSFMHPDTERPFVLAEWVVGFHSFRTYVLQWDGSEFGLVTILGSPPLDGIFSDAGGVFVFEDGSLVAGRQDYLSYQHRIEEVYAFDGTNFQRTRTIFTDESIEDTTPPATSIELSPEPGPSGWNGETTVVTLSAVDEHDVRSISYTRDNAQDSTTTSSPLDRIAFSLEEGRWSITYYAADVYGNLENEHQTSVLIDSTPPRTEISLHGDQGPSGAYVSPVHVELAATDPLLEDASEGSGVERIELSLDGGATWQTYMGPFVITQPGANEVRYRSRDVAGNVEPPNVATVVLNSAPIAMDDTYRIGAHGVLRVPAPGVLGNDEDVDEDMLTATEVSKPAGGRLLLRPDGSFDYVRDPDFYGVDRFTYRASDGYLSSDVAVVELLAPADCEELYGVDTDEDALILIDPATGEGTLVGHLGIDVQTAGLDFDRQGRLWGFSRTSANWNEAVLYTLDLKTGAARVVRRFDISHFPGGAGIEFGPYGKPLYLVSGRLLSILSIKWGKIFPFGWLPFAGASLTLPECRRDFISHDDSGEILWRIRPFRGAKAIGPSGIVQGVSALASASDGTLYGQSNGELYVLDTTHGSGSLVGEIGFRVPGLAFRPPFTQSLCLDEDYDRETGLSPYVASTNERVQHTERCGHDFFCWRHGRRQCPICWPGPRDCGKCGARGFYRLGSGAEMSIQIPELPLAATYRLQFLLRAPHGETDTLNVSAGGATFGVLARGRGWEWTEPVYVHLEAGKNRVLVGYSGRHPVDIEGVRVERNCSGDCRERRFDASRPHSHSLRDRREENPRSDDRGS